jgi:hypothetical protein
MYQYTSKDVNRFWSKVAITANPDECWEWQASVGSHGYGQLSLGTFKNQTIALSHRFVWQIKMGEIPNGMFICHRCDNRRCCNPAHLFVGTYQDNIDDMNKKGRARGGTALGENHGKSKLTNQLVLHIRETYAKGATDLKTLANEVGVSVSTVANVVNRSTWKHVK